MPHPFATIVLGSFAEEPQAPASAGAAATSGLGDLVPVFDELVEDIELPTKDSRRT